METQADRQELAPTRKELGSITLGDLVRRYRDEVVPTKKGANIETIIIRMLLRYAHANHASIKTRQPPPHNRESYRI